MRLYMAGPLFTLAEKEFNASLAAWLRDHGHDVFLPQENEQGGNAFAIFQSDEEGIEQADAIVACMDGTDPDSGTCWEVGYAYARGKKILLYRTDMRYETPHGPYNLMLHQSAHVVLDCSQLKDCMRVADRIDAALKWDEIK